MFDARYFAFASISALLVISPGASMAVVTEAAVSAGRGAALFTVLGINIANASLGLASALGMSLVFHQWPWAMEAIRIAGALYLRTSAVESCGRHGGIGRWRSRRREQRPRAPGSL